MPSPFEDDTAARELLEALRWPNGPRCPRCGAHNADVFLIAGPKHSHREGLYQCKPCRRQFSVTVGTLLERLRVPMSTLVRAAHAFSRDDDSKPTLLEIHRQIGVSYRTVLRMRDIIKQAAGKYRGFKHVFAAWPRSFMGHPRQKREESIRATKVLAASLPPRVYKQGEVNRTERLLRLLLATPKVTPRKRRASPVEVGANSS
jgi:transposase-like protein